MINRQLEMHFVQQEGMTPGRRKRGRLTRAHWWFDHMRDIVSHARDWPTAEPEPEIRQPSSVRIAPAASAISRSSSSCNSVSAPSEAVVRLRGGPELPRWKFRRASGLIWE
jgi:hypothetical protein